MAAPAAFLIPAIAGALVSIVTSLVGRILLALGMGVVSYTGINASLNVFKSYFSNAIGSAGYNLAGLAGVLQLDVACPSSSLLVWLGSSLTVPRMAPLSGWQ